MNQETLQKAAVAEQLAQAAFPLHIQVCTGTACAAQQGEALFDALQSELLHQGQHKRCQIKPVGCPGLCARGPLVNVTRTSQATAPALSSGLSAKIMYQHVAMSDVAEIVRQLDAQVERLLYPTDGPFFARQTKVVLKNCGEINPERIEDYVAHGGYTALLKALTTMTPQQVTEQVTRAGLRGRGGAGFPTGLKWATVAKARVAANTTRPPELIADKFVVCNGDEGDPGAFMDRSLMAGDPHRIVEGMIIAGFAVGARQGYVYVRAEYPQAIKHIRTAIRQAEKNGFLGRHVCGTEFDFDIDVRVGAGAFVCGEETALMASIEGNRGTPRPRPPYPAESGLWGCPTLINNVETFANISAIVGDGAEAFAAIGTEKSKGTKVFALVGQIANTGLIEVPLGITLREIIFEIGGGIPNGRVFKAVQTGGPSGGCIPEQFLDMPVDYESLNQVGTIMGSGGMIVMDDSTSMVDVARYYMEFCKDESCGKCVPCRVGTMQMLTILKRFSARTATSDDMTRLEGLCDLVKHTSLCGLGQTAPNPVLSTLRYFRNEYDERMIDAPISVSPNPILRNNQSCR